jgi:hypothetical protein
MIEHNLISIKRWAMWKGKCPLCRHFTLGNARLSHLFIYLLFAIGYPTTTHEKKIKYIILTFLNALIKPSEQGKALPNKVKQTPPQLHLR